MTTWWTDQVERLNTLWERTTLPEYRAQMINLICKFLHGNPGWTVLDAGCGTGLTYKYLPEWAKKRYIGVDFTPEMIDFCREHYPEGNFIEADIMTPYFPLSDLIITQNVIQHIILWQLAILNLIKHAEEAVLFCERTHDKPTIIFAYDPTRWRFNAEDMLKCMKHCSDRIWGHSKNPELVAHPADTSGEPGLLGIYMMTRGGT